LRVEPDQLQLLAKLPAGLGEDALEDARHGEDCRPHVEAEPPLLEPRRLAAEPVVLLEQHHLVPARREGARGGEPPEPAANDANRFEIAHLPP
jgi:hypothetical protein